MSDLIFRDIMTLDGVRTDKPRMIWYSVHTCWWTHRGEHLYKVPEGRPGVGIPCDPRGSPLFQTDDAEGFLQAAEKNPEHYGKHGLRAFMAAHHMNCMAANYRPSCYEGWEDYNEMLDRYDADQA